jgi:hypothetical protein
MFISSMTFDFNHSINWKKQYKNITLALHLFVCPLLQSQCWIQFPPYVNGGQGILQESPKKPGLHSQKPNVLSQYPVSKKCLIYSDKFIFYHYAIYRIEKSKFITHPCRFCDSQKWCCKAVHIFWRDVIYVT